MTRFSEPTLSPKNYDMSKDWFIHFREYKPGCKPIQHIYKNGLNTKAVKENKKERIKIANKIIFTLKKMIEQGWTPNDREYFETTPLVQSLDNLLEIKRSAIKQKTYEGYKDSIRMFKNWLASKNLSDILPEQFSNKQANQYLDYLLRDRHYSGKSHNTQLGNMKNFFNSIFKRDRERYKGMENPFVGIDLMPEEVGKIFALTKEERHKVQNYLKVRKDPFYYCCCFMYYLALRRYDLANIRKCDIDLVNKMVVLHSSASKNRQQDSVTIMPGFERILEEMNLQDVPDNYYIFGRGFVPSAEKLTRVNDFTEYFRNVAVNVGIDSVKTFYGLKASGLSDLFTATKDPYLIQRQARHSDIRITMTYLRSLGLTVDEKIRKVNIEF